MPNKLDSTGLEVKSLTEINNELVSKFQTIYGADINVDPNSPDGQIIGILSQNVSDVLQVLKQVYNSFSPDSAFGVVLDQRVAINGVQRQQGTFTLAYADVVASQALALIGIDALVSDPTAVVFTVTDDAGNQFRLIASANFAAAGTQTLAFESVTIGAIETTVNTMQTIATPQLGVTSVNNPVTSNDVIGKSEESDSQLRIRRAQSFKLQGIGPADSLRASILEIPGIIDAYVVENDTNGTVAGVGAHSIWTILTQGTATDAQIADVIYNKKQMGCGQTGAVTKIVNRPQGNSFTAKWDLSISQSLTIKANLVTRIPGITFDTAADEIALASVLAYSLGESPSVGDVVQAMSKIEPNAILNDIQVSKDGGATWLYYVSPDTDKHYFTVASGDITLTQ